jgi:hypothetical protein
VEKVLVDSVGVNTIRKIPSDIVKFLGLKDYGVFREWNTLTPRGEREDVW